MCVAGRGSASPEYSRPRELNLNLGLQWLSVRTVPAAMSSSCQSPVAVSAVLPDWPSELGESGRSREILVCNFAEEIIGRGVRHLLEDDLCLAAVEPFHMLLLRHTAALQSYAGHRLGN